MKNNTPDTEDLKVYPNGIMYMRLHMIMVPLSDNRTDLEELAKAYNTIGVSLIEGNILQFVFLNKENADWFIEAMS